MVDGHSFTVIANAPASEPDRAVATFASIKGPSRKVDESWMPATLDAAQNTRLKSAITELLDRDLPGTIENLKLLQQADGQNQTRPASRDAGCVRMYRAEAQDCGGGGAGRLRRSAMN